MSKGVEIQNLDALRRKLGLLTEAERAACAVEVKRSALTIQNAAKRRVPVDRGNLRNRTTHEISRDEQEATIGVMGSGEGDLRLQALAVEFGRRPGMKQPPIDALLGWVRRKRLTGSYSVKTKRRIGSRASQDAEDRSVAFLVARKIAKHGTPARPFLFPSYEEERPKFLSRLRKALDKAHKEVAKK